MGGNGSYDKTKGGVPKRKRTHTETGYTIDGHKVLVQTGNESQTKNIMNSNSKDSIYLMAKLNEDGTLTILNVNANKGHKIGTEINLVFDTHGNLISFNGKKSGSHSHLWVEQSDGNMGRKPVPKGGNGHLPIPDEFKPLLNAIVKFNKKKNIFKKK